MRDRRYSFKKSLVSIIKENLPLGEKDIERIHKQTRIPKATIYSTLGKLRDSGDILHGGNIWF